MLRRTLSAIIVVTLAIACAPDEELAETAAEEATATETEVQAIRGLFRAYVETVNTGDIEAWLAFFTEGVVYMPPNEPTIIGREAVRGWGEPYFDQFDMRETITPDEVRLAGDWAVARLSGTFEVTPKAGGGTAQEIFKAIWILQRQPDGSWKAARTIWNSDNPLSGGE
jgi:uncharacterized protein (TIGR02246 family)